MAEKDYKNVMHLGNPTNTIAVLNRYGFSFQKKFGQNFLIDENVVEKIVRDAGVTKDDFVLEIGPGIGTMTQILCENAREVVAVEIDDKLIPILMEDTLSWYDNVTVIHEDILKLDIVKLANERNGGKPIKVVANLPYYITTPELIYEGHVYVAMPPLYKAIPSRGEEEYLYDDEALERYRRSHKGSFTLQRYKGLGEMDAEQLWETTLDPKRRLLKRIEIEDGRMASDITELLMGNDVPPRKTFIYEHATDATVDA